GLGVPQAGAAAVVKGQDAIRGEPKQLVAQRVLVRDQGAQDAPGPHVPKAQGVLAAALGAADGCHALPVGTERGALDAALELLHHLASCLRVSVLGHFEARVTQDVQDAAAGPVVEARSAGTGVDPAAAAPAAADQINVALVCPTRLCG